MHDVEFAASAEEPQRRCGIDHLLMIDGGAGDSAYERALAAHEGSPVERAALTHDGVVTIMYTSGTTGSSKGAMITHGMNFWNAVNLGIPAGVGIDTVHLRRPSPLPHRWPQLPWQTRSCTPVAPSSS